MTEPERCSPRYWDELYSILEQERSSGYVLSPDLSLRYVNNAWKQFALDNGAPQLASDWRALGPITDAIAPELQGFFAARFALVLHENQAWSYLYECSRPDRFRTFNMRVEATPNQEGLVVVHSLMVEVPLLDHPAFRAQLAEFTDSNQTFVRCSACGRLRRQGDPQSWQWVPGLDESTARVSHGICPLCSLQFYGAGFCALPT